MASFLLPMFAIEEEAKLVTSRLSWTSARFEYTRRYRILTTFNSAQRFDFNFKLTTSNNMSDAAAAPAVAAAPAKKAKKATKPKAPAAHPKYSVMVQAAITALKERSGSSKQAILKYISANYKVGDNPTVVNTQLKRALKSGVKDKLLKQTKGTGASGSFRLGEKKAEKPKKVAKPKSPKKAAKKPAAKKAAAAKPKKAAKSPAKKAAKSPAKKAVKPKKVAKSPAKKVAKPKAAVKKAAAKPKKAAAKKPAAKPKKAAAKK